MELSTVIKLWILTQLCITLAYGKGGRGFGHGFHSSHGGHSTGHGGHSTGHGGHSTGHGGHSTGTVVRPVGWDIPKYNPNPLPPYRLDSSFINSASRGSFASAPLLPSGSYYRAPSKTHQGSLGLPTAPASHYNPPIGVYSQLQPVFVHSGQSSSSLDSLVKGPVVDSIADTSVKASVNRYLPRRVYFHPLGRHGSGSNSVTTNDTQSGSVSTPVHDKDHEEGTAVNQSIPPVVGSTVPTNETQTNVTSNSFEDKNHEEDAAVDESVIPLGSNPVTTTITPSVFAPAQINCDDHRKDTTANQTVTQHVGDAVPTNPRLTDLVATQTDGNDPKKNATVNQTVTPAKNETPVAIPELIFTSPTGCKVYKHAFEHVTERLFRKDVNNAFKQNYITLKFQEMIIDDSMKDIAAYDLLTVDNPSVEAILGDSVLDTDSVLRLGDSFSVQPEDPLSTVIQAWEIPTIKALLPLHDNYEMDVTKNEIVTEEHRNEEGHFIDAILHTRVMKNAKKYLIRKGYVKDDATTFKKELKTMWFTRFGRVANATGSSGFEYVFLAENMNNQIIGLHNWVYYAKKEEAHQLNYFGYIGQIPSGNRGVFVKVRSQLNGIDSPATTLFIGLSPELEISLYTLCFYISPGYPCPIKLNGKEFHILVERHRFADEDILTSADTEYFMEPESSS